MLLPRCACIDPCSRCRRNPYSYNHRHFDKHASDSDHKLDSVNIDGDRHIHADRYCYTDEFRHTHIYIYPIPTEYKYSHHNLYSPADIHIHSNFHTDHYLHTNIHASAHDYFYIHAIPHPDTDKYNQCIASIIPNSVSIKK